MIWACRPKETKKSSTQKVRCFMSGNSLLIIWKKWWKAADSCLEKPTLAYESISARANTEERIHCSIVNPNHTRGICYPRPKPLRKYFQSSMVERSPNPTRVSKHYSEMEMKTKILLRLAWLSSWKVGRWKIWENDFQPKLFSTLLYFCYTKKV